MGFTFGGITEARGAVGVWHQHLQFGMLHTALSWYLTEQVQSDIAYLLSWCPLSPGSLDGLGAILPGSVGAYGAVFRPEPGVERRVSYRWTVDFIDISPAESIWPTPEKYVAPARSAAFCSKGGDPGSCTGDRMAGLDLRRPFLRDDGMGYQRDFV